MLDSWKASSPLVIDAGNALFRNAGVATDDDRARASFIFEVMEDLGVKVMAVGQRDLSSGTAFLEKLAKAHKVKVLSANLQREGKRVFDASTIVEWKGSKIAFIGLTTPGPVAPNEPNVAAAPTVETLKAVLAGLGPRDVTVVLAATSYADAMQLSTDFADTVDFVVQSGEFRGTVPPQRLNPNAAVLLGSGQKGQAMGKLKLWLGNGKGPFADLTVGQRDQQQADFVGEQIKQLKSRLAMAKDKEAIAQLKTMLVDFEKRHAELQKAAKAATGSTVRRFDFQWSVLGRDVADEAKLKARVLKIEPSYQGQH